jgi:hypothetical protein
MSTITYDTAATVRPGTAAAAPASKRKGWFARALDRMVAARQRQAMEEIRRHGIALPSDQPGWKVTERSEDSLPFTR